MVESQISYSPESEEKIANWLNSRFGSEKFTPGLDRIRELFGPINSEIQKRGIKVVTVAGTNGKGETVYALSNLMKVKGGVGVWSSPHVLSIRERFLFSGEMISYESLFECMKESYELVIGENFSLSYYEFLFYIFLKVALDRDVEHLVLEVGLGGRLDAVNLIDPNVTAITSISRDHEAILGRGFKKILYEKLGITRAKIPLITSLELGYLQKETEIFCKKRGTPWKDIFHKGEGFSKSNQRVAQELFKTLFEGEEALIEESYHPGRFEKICWKGNRFLLMGTHNLDGFRKLVDTLLNTRKKLNFRIPFDRIFLAFSKRPAWEIDAIIKLMESTKSDLGHEVVLTTFDHEKALDQLEEKGTVKFAKDWKSYLKNSGEKSQEILLVGSFYFIGEVKKFFLQNS